MFTEPAYHFVYKQVSAAPVAYRSTHFSTVNFAQRKVSSTFMILQSYQDLELVDNLITYFDGLTLILILFSQNSKNFAAQCYTIVLEFLTFG